MLYGLLSTFVCSDASLFKLALKLRSLTHLPSFALFPMGKDPKTWNKKTKSLILMGGGRPVLLTWHVGVKLPEPGWRKAHPFHIKWNYMFQGFPAQRKLRLPPTWTKTKALAQMQKLAIGTVMFQAEWSDGDHNISTGQWRTFWEDPLENPLVVHEGDSLELLD